MTPRQALAFVEKDGIVLQSARGRVPSFLVRLSDRFPAEALARVWSEHTAAHALRAILGAWER